MKKHFFFYGASILLTLGFIIKVLIDYGVYNSTLNSAPFISGSLWTVSTFYCPP